MQDFKYILTHHETIKALTGDTTKESLQQIRINIAEKVAPKDRSILFLVRQYVTRI